MHPVADIDLAAYANGAWVVVKPAERDPESSSFWLFDGDPRTGWRAPKGDTATQQLVIALPGRSRIRELEFDSGTAVDVLAESSNAGPDRGFRTIATVALEPGRAAQRFAVAKPLTGRWLRFTVSGTHGSGESIELANIHARGELLAKASIPDLSGTYASNYGKLHLRQVGRSMSGCYEFEGGLISNGRVDGRVLRFDWVQPGPRGPAIFSFSPDGREFAGQWWYDGKTGQQGGLWTGNKISTEVGTCEHWPGAASVAAPGG